MSEIRRNARALLVCALCVVSSGAASAVQFSALTDLQTGIGFTSVLDLGPEDPDPASRADGCIYAVHGSNGTVNRICFDSNKAVTSNTVVVDLNGGGSVNNVLGITFDPNSDPATEIHLYLGYSPDNGAPFQGRIARAVSTDGGASYSVDETFITGLARSAFDHQTNGLDFGPDGCLYVSQGNNSNAGYDSAHAESRLSSAILRACFNSAPLTLNGSFVRNCGGGNTQSPCDVEVFASGLRNPYDIVWHSNGRLYNADNDSNPGFRDNCGAEANNFGCSCEAPLVTPIGDEINLIEQGMYYGSPNPYRAHPNGLQCQGGTDGGDACSVDGDCGGGGTCEDLSAYCTDGVCGDIAQCHYFGYGDDPQSGEDPNGIYRAPIAQVGSLLDGITEYRSRFDGRFGSSFCSDWNGDLLVTGGPGSVRRFELSSDGTAASHSGTSNLNGISGLDVVVGADGTVYAADLNGGKVTFITPQLQTNPAQADYFNFCTTGEACVAGTCVVDGDNDGIGDGVDPCPTDPLNRCVGPVATDATTTQEIRINASTGAHTCAGTKVDCNGDTWNADFGYNQAADSFECDLAGGCPVDTTAILGCTDAASEDLFQCEHWDAATAPELLYSFDVPDGDYVVNLLFMNAFTGSANPGDRFFDIVIEGITEYAGFDQVAAAGGSGIPVVRSAEVSVSDGNGLQIELQHVPNGENPAIKGIEVLEVYVPPECLVDADCDDANPCTDDSCSAETCTNAPNTDVCDDGAACTSGDMCSGGVCSGTSTCSSGEICNPITDLCETPAVQVRINVNGPAHTGTDYPGNWSADPGSGGVCGANAYSTGSAINGTVDDVLFQGEVWGNPVTCAVDDGGVPLPPGDYEVTLHFAEIYFGDGCPGGGGTGSRVFDIVLENTTVETGFDAFAEGGCAASTTNSSTSPVSRTFTVNVSDGTLNVSLPASANNGKISAIEIVSAGPPPECTVDLDCDDADLCTIDSCNAGSCGHIFDADQCVDVYPYSEDFDEGPGIWINTSGDDFDWSLGTGSTPTANTGPTGDHTSGSGDYYFTEATGHTPGQIALLEGPCVDLAGMQQALLSFWYDMNGADMGSLDVELDAGCTGSWASAWNLSGDQGSGWHSQAVDLSAHAGGRVGIRFVGSMGVNDTSDMAVDDVTVSASVLPPTSVPTEVQMPGTQPGEVASLEEATNCSLCHQGYSPGAPMDEPSHGWGGSMMSHASRDPIFWAAMAVAEQDFGGSGDLCLRCHLPGGWLAGRSEPTDGSAMLESDADGVRCDLCHKLTNPDGSEFVGVQNVPYLANDEGAPSTGYYGSGQFVISGQSEKLGPYSNASAPHPFAQSNFHRSEDMCGTCHDVSNPVVGDLAPGNGAMVPLQPGTFSGTPGAPVSDKAAFNNFPHAYGAVERTTSEHAASAFSGMPISDFATLPAELQAGSLLAARDAALLAGNGGDYEDGTPRTFTCQSCHMKPSVGEGCSLVPPVRGDLPNHDLTGGNYWAPDAIQHLDGLGKLRLGGGLNASQVTQMNAGKLRAKENLEEAGSLSVTGNTLRVVNLTGHKLITGYPEGRRMWLNVKWFDAGDVLIDEDGAYGPVAVTIDGQPTLVDTIVDPASTTVYEIRKAITQEWAVELLGLGLPGTTPLTFDDTTGAVTNTLADLIAMGPGTHLETKHFVLNNEVVWDNRIPPFGLSYDDARTRSALPIPETQYGDPGPGGTYDYWDEVDLAPPVGAHHASIELLYQPTSWEYIQFLYLANDGSNSFLADEGQNILDAWLATGMAAPHTMASTTWTAPACSNTLDDDGDGLIDDLDPGCDSPEDTTETCGPSDDTTCDGVDDDCDGLIDEDFDDALCSDGLFCNGTEACVAGACAPGTPVICDDGVACTTDACNVVLDACEFITDDGACADATLCNGIETCDALLGCLPGVPLTCENGQFCDGSESCDPVLGCVAGTPPPTSDGVDCTVDGCDESTDTITHFPDDVYCSDGDACTGVETCHATLDCQPATSLDCDDGNACTADACDAISGCSHDPIEGCVVAVPSDSPPGLLLLALMLAAAGGLTLIERRKGVA